MVGVRVRARVREGPFPTIDKYKGLPSRGASRGSLLPQNGTVCKDAETLAA